MARIRSIKPEFWTSEQVMECSALARLLFIGLWTFCDDAGNHPAKALTLKAEVFPGDDIGADRVLELVGELSANDLVVEYESGGKRYWHVTGWDVHQRVERPNFKHPQYVKQLESSAVGDVSPITRRSLADQSPINRSPVDPGIGIGIGIGDGNGGDAHACAPAPSAALPIPVNGSFDENPDAQEPPYPPPSAASPSMAGAVCVALKSVGMGQVNPGNQTLKNLIESGADIGLFVEVGRDCVAKGKSFAYLLGAVRGRMGDAQRLATEAIKPRTATLPNGLLPGAI